MCVCVCVTSCLELPVNVVECYTWKVPVSHQFQDKEPYDVLGLETVPGPLGRQPGNVKCPVSIYVFCSCHTNLKKLQLWMEAISPYNGGVILGYKSIQVTAHR